jgi:hypothetical protein
VIRFGVICILVEHRPERVQGELRGGGGSMCEDLELHISC